jgi:hypothetical protein
MTLTVTCKRMPTAERGSSDRNQQRSYEFAYQIEQTDSGALASAQAMITAAQSAGSTPLPTYGANPSYESTTDLDSYAQQFTWFRPQPADRPKLLQVEVQFLPAESSNPGRLTEHDPLLWPVEYWAEWTEESVPLEEAYNVNAMTAIDRPALTLGPLVNACGIEFADPQMKTNYYIVLHAQKHYATLEEIVALNVNFQNTTNNSTFFGASKRSAKYLGTESGRIQKINGQSFYVGITRIWFKKTKTDGSGNITGGWDRGILNNGWSHFEFGDDFNWILNDAGRPKIFPNLIFDPNDPDATTKTMRPSEPLNLSPVGAMDAPMNFLYYRDLAEVDYSGIGIGS